MVLFSYIIFIVNMANVGQKLNLQSKPQSFILIPR